MSLYITLIASLIVGLAVGVSAWTLVESRRREAAAGRAKECGQCGSAVLDDWRLCPECGGFIDGADSGVPGGGSGVRVSE